MHAKYLQHIMVNQTDTFHHRVREKYQENSSQILHLLHSALSMVINRQQEPLHDVDEIAAT